MFERDSRKKEERKKRVGGRGKGKGDKLWRRTRSEAELVR